MNLFCEEVHKLEAEFKQCRKLLNAIGDENRQHLICVMMNMPIDGGPCSGDCRALKKAEKPYGDRTQNHGQYKNPYTKI